MGNFCRTFLTLVEVGWNALGTIWLCQSKFLCGQAPAIQLLIKGTPRREL